MLKSSFTYITKYKTSNIHEINCQKKNNKPFNMHVTNHKSLNIYAVKIKWNFFKYKQSFKKYFIYT